MKHLIYSFLILFLTVSISAQTSPNGLIFVAEEVQFGTKSYEYTDNQFQEQWIWEDAQAINVPIYLGEGYVDMQNEGNVKITFTKKHEVQEYTDDEGDNYLLFPFDGIDNEGKELLFYVQAWNNYELVRLLLYYDDLAVCYSGYLQ